MKGASISLALLALSCFFLSLVLGLVSAIAIAWPETFIPHLSFATLRPLHTLFAFGWVICGTVFAVHLILGKRPGNLTVFLLCSGFLLAAISLLSGNGTGREYISWPLSVNVVLFAGLSGAAVSVSKKLSSACDRNRDAAWMIGTGILLLPLSLAETSLYLIPSIGNNIGKDIAVQWHSVDTMIGAWNLVLFGSALLIRGDSDENNTGGWWRTSLFIVAVSGLLFTFGHHYYPSPQPMIMKKIAFYSSLLAAIAFLDHWMKRKEKINSANITSGLFLKFASYWTLFSIATGFLMAIPAINVYTHGTYFVVAHSMGSMIGVNSMIILALFFSGIPLKDKDFTCKVFIPATVFNGALLFMVLLLMGAGIAKGFWRLSLDYTEYIANHRMIISPLPLAGLIMLISTLPVIREGLKFYSSIAEPEGEVESEGDEEISEYG